MWTKNIDMNFVSFVLCFIIRILDLLIRAFDTFCLRVMNICDSVAPRPSATAAPQLRPPLSRHQNGSGKTNSLGAFGQKDLRKWLLRLLGVILFLAYFWAMFQEDEDSQGEAGRGMKKRKKKMAAKLAFTNFKM